MAFYRCGGGGIPSSLKTDMNAVLNKKFGTSADYPPADWPDTVNLMGPLPEATVSGSVAHLEDGADEVPIKKCEITLPASLDGYSEVDVVHEGLNQCYETDSDLFPRENGSIINSATHTAYAKAKKNTTVYITKQGNTNRQIAFGFSELPAVGVNAVQLTLTVLGNNQWSVNSGNYEYLAFYYSSEASENIMFSYLQDSTYEPYTAPTQYTADLGRTIHGGTADVVNGTGTDENGNDFTFDGQEINTRLGYNAFWSDSGDTEVTYRADINLALGGQ